MIDKHALALRLRHELFDEYSTHLVDLPFKPNLANYNLLPSRSLSQSFGDLVRGAAPIILAAVGGSVIGLAGAGSRRFRPLPAPAPRRRPAGRYRRAIHPHFFF